MVDPDPYGISANPTQTNPRAAPARTTMPQSGLINDAPLAAQPVDPNAYIGVPQNYVYSPTTSPVLENESLPGGMGQTAQQYQRAVAPRTPLYTESYISNARSASASDVMNIQVDLVNHGLLQAGAFTPGAFDAATERAFRSVLEVANYKGSTIKDVYANAEAGFDVFGGPGGESALPPDQINRNVSVTSRPRAQALMMQALSDELGRGPSDEEVDRFLKALNTEERAAPTVTTTRYERGPNGELVANTEAVESNVAPEAEAAEFAESAAPEEAQQYGQHKVFSWLQDLISRSA